MTWGWLRPYAAGFAALCLSLAGAGSAVAATAPAASGPDFCTTDTGVTVVVDLTAFGGGVVVRCVEGPLPSSYTGWDALEDAGFSPVAPSRTPGFACRLAGEPAASRSFDLPGNPGYHEQCVNTPPTSAYWGYWYAENGGSWTYSSSGAASHRVIEGGFEGWAFALNSGGTPPTPKVAPRHAVTQPETPSTSTPSTSGSGDHSNGGPGGGSGHHGNDGGPTESPTSGGPTSSPATGDKPDDRPRKHRHQRGPRTPDTSSASPTPSTPTSSDDVVLTSDLPSDGDDEGGGGSALPTLIGVAVVALLGVGAGVTAWRRRSG